jgi:hypothetical protein
MNDLTAEKLAATYLKIRTKRQQLLTAFEAEDNDLKIQQDLISGRMLEICKETGADSIKTPSGTIIKSVKTRYWTSDWGSMHAFIKEHDALDLLEQRLHQTNMKQFLEEHPDVLPMGLNSDSKYSISVRKR